MTGTENSTATTGDRKPSTTLEILTRARALIRRPENWTQGAWARSKKNTRVRRDSEVAVCWCAQGAIRRVARKFIDAMAAEEAVMRAAGDFSVASLAGFNDAHTHAEVLAAFDKAISALKSPVG